MNKPTIFVVLGPTSCGKTGLTLDLCGKIGGEIISADSRQIYKYMDVGTGKIPGYGRYFVRKYNGKWVVNNITIWGYDLIEPGIYFSAYDFFIFGKSRVEKLIKAGKPVFVVGGTGFYIDVLTGRKIISRNPPVFELRRILSLLPQDKLCTKLKQLDPVLYKNIDLNNKHRVMRAIERISNNGAKNFIDKLEVNFRYIGLTANRNLLYAKADNWVNEVWKNGLIQETNKLVKQGFANTPQMNSLIYKTAKEYLLRNLDEADALQRIKFDIHAYIRRQQTWFKLNPEIVWFDVSSKSYKREITDFVSKYI